MSRARHKLTGIRHAIHSTKTYQGGSNGTEVIEGGSGGGGGGWSATTDGDSYIWTSVGGIGTDEWDIPVGQASNWHDSSVLAVGSSGWAMQSPSVYYTHRLLYNLDLFADPDSEMNVYTEIINATLTLRVAGGDGYGPDDEMDTKICNIYRTNKSYPDDIDTSYACWYRYSDTSSTWTSPGGAGLGDIDTAVSASFDLKPMDFSDIVDGSEPWSVGDAVEIDFTTLVQDAVTNRNGLLKTTWIKPNDYYSNIVDASANKTMYRNKSHFYSGNHNAFDLKPKLTIQWHNP